MLILFISLNPLLKYETMTKSNSIQYQKWSIIWFFLPLVQKNTISLDENQAYSFNYSTKYDKSDILLCHSPIKLLISLRLCKPAPKTAQLISQIPYESACYHH